MHFLLTPLLVLLLALTTPIGTGSGVHQDDLLHPLLPHVHLVNGRVVSHQQALDSTPQSTTAGPAIGAGAGSDQADAGVAVSPPLPVVSAMLAPNQPDWRFGLDSLAPQGRVDAPPDPPPPTPSV